MTEILLGSAYDDDLFYRLVAEIEAMGGSITDKEWILGGPEEVTRFEVLLPGGQFEAIARTEAGLSLQGESALVEVLADRVKLNRQT